MKKMEKTSPLPEGPLTVDTIKRAIDDAYAQKPDNDYTFWAMFQHMLSNGLDYSEGNPIKIAAKYWEEVDKAYETKGKKKRKCKKGRYHKMVS